MGNTNKFSLALPPNSATETAIETSQSVVFIGANGSGKTRLGVWIENDLQNKAHRISAQKSLTMPESVSLEPAEETRTSLLYTEKGRERSPNKTIGTRNTYRWGNKPATHLLNDYPLLVTYLLSDNSEESVRYRNKSLQTEEKVELTETKIDTVKKIWEKIIPDKALILKNASIETRIKNNPGTNSSYNASEMSDGERVIFYLIGQSLAAPANGIIIIDEPELHLHKSIQIPLWTEIEQLRPDCMFVYFTHDVGFSASHHNAQKIWIKSFDGTTWDWEKIQGVDGFPEELLIEILGNHKPVVFVEGDKGSNDAALYRSILSDFLVIPIGSCSEVIRHTKVLCRSGLIGHLNQMGHFEVYGIIDRDRRSDAEVEKLENNGIYVLEAAEVENLFCTKEILSIISKHLERDEKKDFENIKCFSFEHLGKELETQILASVKSEIKYKINQIDISVKDISEVNQELQNQISSINVDSICNEKQNLFNEVFNSKNYDQLLKFYNRKSLSDQISPILGLTNNGLPKLVIRLAQGNMRKEIREALKPYFGNFAEHMDKE